MTQRTLASLMKMDTAYLSRIENDYHNHLPSQETIERFVRHLGVKYSDELHALAGKIPVDVERILLAHPEMFKLVRKQAKGKK